MANLIDASYFVGEINLVINQERLNHFIKNYEMQYLIGFLGYDLYKQFIEGLNVQPNAEAKWTKLKNGDEFTDYNSRLNKWLGFTNDFKKSPIANYVYYHYLRDGISQTTAVGEVQSNTQNSSVISPIDKMVRAYNEMVDLTNLAICYLQVNKATYPSFEIALVNRSLINKINKFNI